MEQTTKALHNARPISPHIGIYKPQISSVLFFGHRITSIWLFFGISVLSWWFILWVFSRFDQGYLEIFNNGFIKLFLILTSYSFFYHLCIGIRSLILSTGYGFSILAINYSGIGTIVISIVLTLIFLIGII